MKNHIILLIISLIASSSFSQSRLIHDYSFTDINGNTVELRKFEGKKILFVNVASKCGFTPQYDQLQELHKKYQDKLVIIGFPCNQFMNQESGSEDEIQAFCRKNYGVEFLMASKIDVKGKNQHPIYRWLTSKELNGFENNKVNWNFNKYIVDENGNLLARFESKVKPTDEKITALIEKLTEN